MHAIHPVSLLVAALVLLRHPCARSKTAARLLLERAAENAELTWAEREACQNLVDDLELDEPTSPAAHRRDTPAQSPCWFPAKKSAAPHRDPCGSAQNF